MSRFTHESPHVKRSELADWEEAMPGYRWMEAERRIVRNKCREHGDDATGIDLDRRVHVTLPGGNSIPAAAVHFPDGTTYDAILGCFRHDREAIRDAASRTEWDLEGAPEETVQAARNVAQRVREVLEDATLESGAETNGVETSGYEAGVDYLRHIRQTEQHIGAVRTHIGDIVQCLQGRAATHDQSKLEEPEASQWAQAKRKLENLEYGSEEYHEALEELPTEHHYAANRHHPEHFEDGLKGMHLVDLVEMFADWMAAVERHDDDADIHDSIEQNKERFGYGEPLASILHNTADLLNDAPYKTPE